ncbi:MAG: L,D-transpeptidase family protein [Chthoniobacterales bacterium]
MAWKIVISLAGLLCVFATGYWFTRSGKLTADRIVIRKAERIMTLYKNEKTLGTYRINLGFAPEGAKHFEGDGKTPEGQYFISEHNPRSSYHLSLRISYPDARDTDFAAQTNLSAGCDIMIHGLPNGDNPDDPKYTGKDWTLGCIAVTNREIEEIYRQVPDGTPIEILP